MMSNQNRDKNLSNNLYKQKQADKGRSKQTALYIVQRLMRLPLRSSKTGPKPENSNYGPRFLGDYIFGIDFSEEEEKAYKHGNSFLNGTKTKSLGQVIAILANLRKNLLNEYAVKTGQTNARSLTNTPIPSSVQILKALQAFSQLTSEELDDLGLPRHCQHPLLQQAFVNLATMSIEHEPQMPEAYRKIYSMSLSNADEIKDCSKNFTSIFDLSEHISDRLTISAEEQAAEMHRKVKNAVKRLLLQAGTGQIRYITLDDQAGYIGCYLGEAFMNLFTDTVCKNNLITQKVPITLSRTTQERIGVFPLPRPDDNPSVGWMSNTLLEIEGKGNAGAVVEALFTQLPTSSVMEVSGHFYVRLKASEIQPDGNYQGFDYKTHCEMRNVIGEEVRVPFKVTTTGISGTNALITRVVNQALLSDIKGLRETYFPIAQSLFVKQTNVSQRVLSPVTNHCFVRLCEKEALAAAMFSFSQNREEIPRYDDFSGYDARGAGNYCEFDMIHAASRSAVMARLEAIYNTGLDSRKYVYSLLARTEQQYILEEASTLLTGYPFSAFAMASALETNLLGKADQSDYQESYVLYNARLLIIETFLTEGAYKKAYKHLKILHDTLKQASQTGIDWVKSIRKKSFRRKDSQEVVSKIVSSQIIARYEICLARYLLLLDIDEAQANSELTLNLVNKQSLSRSILIEKAWEHLTRADIHLTVRLMKYHIIDEISQATLQPYYKLLADIYFYRAKLFVWYPSLLSPKDDMYCLPTQENGGQNDSQQHANCGRLYLFERARLFAACDGNDVLYAISTAYQCRSWLRAAFTQSDGALTFSQGSDFDRDTCMTWALKLRNHALLKYAPTGRRCYHEIKEKSGLLGRLESQTFGQCEVVSICPIRETVGTAEPGFSDGVLYLDMDFLSVRRHLVDQSNPQSSEGIYMFGPQACHLFLIRGLYHLCSNDSSEFSTKDSIAGNAPLSLSDWNKKLKRCYQLFNYAWSIAGDGCKISPSSAHNGYQEITREMEKTKEEGIANGIKESHAESVWNLYPHRISEIAEIGVLYAATCLSLLCYTTKLETERTEYRHGMTKLLGSLPCAENYSLDNDLKDALDNQHQINGHLSSYLAQCSELIQDVASRVSNEDTEKIGEIRELLLNELFSLSAL